jgi:hypothetical protein
MALFVKADVADSFMVERNGSASFAMLPSALSVSPLSLVTRCIVRCGFERRHHPRCFLMETREKPPWERRSYSMYPSVE